MTVGTFFYHLSLFKIGDDQQMMAMKGQKMMEKAEDCSQSLNQLNETRLSIIMYRAKF